MDGTTKGREREISGLKDQLDRVHSEFDQKVIQLESNIRQKDKDISEGLGIIKSLQEENQRLQELVTQGVKQMQDARSEIEMLSDSNRQLELTVADLKEEIQSWIQKLHVCEKEKGQERDSLLLARNDIEKMKIECGKALDALKISKELEDKLQTELETVRNEHSRHLNDMELTERKRNEELCDRIEAMGQKIGQLTRANEDLQRDLVSAQNEIDRLRGRVESQTTLVQNLQNALEEKTSDLENARKSREDTLNTIESLESKLDQFTQDVESLSSQKSDLESRLGQTSAELHSLTTSTLPTLTSTLSQQRTELALKTQEVSDLNAFVYKLETELRDTATILRSLESELASRREQEQEEFGRLEQALEEARESIVVWGSGVWGEERNEGLEGELERERRQRDAREREVESERSRRKDLEERLSKEEKEHKLAAEKVQELEETVDSKEGELVELATFCKSTPAAGHSSSLHLLSRLKISA